MLFIKIKKIFYRGDFKIGLFFDFDENLKNKAKSIGAHWSQTHKCLYMLYNKENYNLMRRNFDNVEIIRDENNERPTGPAVMQQKTVHIAETISEIRSDIQAEHKELTLEIASKIVFSGNAGKYWILKVPY